MWPISLGDAWGILESACRGSLLDYLFRSVGRSPPIACVKLKTYRTDYRQWRWEMVQAGLNLLEDIDSSTRGFCAILSSDLVAHERSLSFTYGRPEESWSSLEEMHFGKRRASGINLLNFADDIVRGGNCRKRAILKNRSDILFINLD